MKIEPDYRGDLAKAARESLGYSQKEMADMLGMTLNSWQKKEQNDTRVSVAEYHYLKLLVNDHPEYMLIHRIPEGKTLQQEAAQNALLLAQRLSEPVVLPSKVEALQDTLNGQIESIREEWEKSITW
ncbi:hypothetical protein [Pantoea agglomerans]|uniref:hypothetical protein n=1 Tax=Enterobacter agglomerans TaxID=549 RepID=UPI00241343AC|nr:hypothetical protein [Pantoea agglomerans]